MVLKPFYNMSFCRKCYENFKERAGEQTL